MKTTAFATLLCVLLPLALAEAPFNPQETYAPPRQIEESFSSGSGSALPPAEAAPESPRIVYVLNHIPHITVIEKPVAHHQEAHGHYHAEAVHGAVHHDLHGHVAHQPVPYAYGHHLGAVPVVHDGHHLGVNHAVPVVHDDHHLGVHHTVPVVLDDHHLGVHNTVPVAHGVHHTDGHQAAPGILHDLPLIYFSSPDVPVVHGHHDDHHVVPVVHDHHDAHHVVPVVHENHDVHHLVPVVHHI